MAPDTRVVDRLAEAAADVDATYYESAFYGVVLAYVLAVVAAATGYGADARLFPLLVGVALVILLVGKLVATASESVEFAVAGLLADVFDGLDGYEAGERPDDAERYRRDATMLGWLVALLVLVWLLGFYPAALVYVTGFVYQQEGDLRRALALGVGTTVCLYALFIGVLSASTYGGVLAGLV